MHKAFLILFAAAMIGAFGTTHVFAETAKERILAKCQKEREQQRGNQNYECKLKKRH
jgi:hypothetical protein